MNTKLELGKITHVKFGTDYDRPFLFGTTFTFNLGRGGGIGCGGKYTCNMSDIDEYTKFTVQDQQYYLHEQAKQLIEWLRQAKVNSVAELKGIPVEVTLDGNMFKSFRILEEVL